MRLPIEWFIKALGAWALLMLAAPACHAEHLYARHVTCSRQLDYCIGYGPRGRTYWPYDTFWPYDWWNDQPDVVSEGLCNMAFWQCMRTGVFRP
jgi:hypothetical protein